MHVLKFLFALYIVSTSLHFGWEISQMSLYDVDAMSVQEHWVIALKDAAIVVGIYLVAALAVRNSSWGKRFNGKRLATVLALGFLWAASIEYHAVEVAHRWAYAGAMPIIPILNVGLVPVLQMMVLPVVGILLVRRYLSEK